MSRKAKLTVAEMRIVAPPADLIFAEQKRCQRSIYQDKLQDALSAGHVIQVRADDISTISQFKTKAKKLSIKLVFAWHGEFIYIKPLQMTEDMRKLMLLLREPRTENSLRAAKLGLNLDSVLERLVEDGMARQIKTGVHANSWHATDKGLETLK